MRFNVNQAYMIDDRHIGMQCHIEMTRDLIDDVARLRRRRVAECLSSRGRAEAPPISARHSTPRLATLHGVAGDVYARWAQGLVRSLR